MSALSAPVILIGTHGSGKSTLAKRLAERLNVGITDGHVREVLKDQQVHLGEHRNNLEIIDTQNKIMNAVLGPILAQASKAAESGIIVRSPLDVYAYSLQALGKCEEAEHSLIWQAHICRQMGWSPGTCILVPPNIPFVSDGVRECRNFHRLNIHLLLKGMLAEFGYRYFELGSYGLAEREEEAMTYIRSREQKTVAQWASLTSLPAGVDKQ